MTRVPSTASRTPAGIVRRIAGLVALAGFGLLALSLPAAVSAATLEGRFVSQPGGSSGGGHPAGALPAGGSDRLCVVITPMEGGAPRRASVGLDGRFVVTDLPAGRVAVVVGPEQGGTPEAARIVTLTERGTNRVTLGASGASAPAAPTFQFTLYRGEYYDDQPGEGTATPLGVTAPGSVSGVNLDLATGGGTLGGRVTADADGAPVADVLVFAFGRSSFILSFDRTDANGDYRITGIPADSFYVSVNAFFFLNDNDWVGEYYNNSPSLFGATEVRVSEGEDVDGINFGLARGGNISGRLTAEQGGAPIAGATIVADGVLPLVVTRLTITNENGDYNIRALTPGSYTLRFQPDGGYVEEYYNNRTSEGAADPVVVTAGNTTGSIDATLTTGGTITGRILATGSLDPIPDVVVAATRVGETFSYQALTAADGSYSIDGLATGNYRVGVPELSRWYDNRDSEGLADPVAVTAGQTRSNVDITATVFVGGCGVDPQSRVTISGRVLADGQPVNDAELYLHLEISPGAREHGVLPPGDRFIVAVTNSNANGLYSFECLDVGTYYVQCFAPGTDRIGEWYANSDSAGATPLEFIFGGTRTDIDFDLEPGAKISGRITTGGGTTGVPFVPVYARHQTSGEVFESTSDTAGNYSIDSGDSGGLPTGNYLVWVEDHTTANLGLVPIALSRFVALPAPDGIALEWSRASGDAVGFHVERADSPAGSPLRLTGTPIAGAGEGRYVDHTAQPGLSYTYWLVGVERDGGTHRFGPLTATYGAATVTRLLGVTPNPLVSSATIRFTLAAASVARIRVFDLAGRQVRTLLDAPLSAGTSSITWDGRTDLGADAPAGIYFVRSELGDRIDSRKIVVRR